MSVSFDRLVIDTSFSGSKPACSFSQTVKP